MKVALIASKAQVRHGHENMGVIQSYEQPTILSESLAASR